MPPDRATAAATTALLTDHYELTMLQAALVSGTAHRQCVFELFGRHLPAGRRYGVVAGTARALEAVERFSFDDETLRWMSQAQVVDQATCRWLEDFRFHGEVWVYPEGETYFPSSPLMVVRASFAEAVVLETLLLSVLNHDSAVASAASRMTGVAQERPCLEMGSRRTHERAAVAAARAAYVAGFASTSNLQAGRAYGVPTSGTSAHSFTLVHDSERAAFSAQVDSLGSDTTLLVDTYDIAEAVAVGVQVAGPHLGAVRIDSGDLPALAVSVREQLDALGATKTRIVVTSDLDEHAIAALAAAPVDGYGVGTSVVTGSGHPTCGFVYKLVAREDPSGELVGVAKSSSEKLSIGGRKWATRRLGADGVAQAEVISVGHRPTRRGDDRELLVPAVRAGELVFAQTLEDARARHLCSRAELPPSAHQLSRGEAAIPTLWDPEQDTSTSDSAAGGSQ